MSAVDPAQIVALLGALVIVGAALRSRCLHGATMLRLAILWIAIIAVAWLVASIGLNVAHS